MKKLPLLAGLLLAVVSCIRNDIPYPSSEPVISSLSVGGCSAVSINETERTVVLTLEETTDIKNVSIKHAELSAHAESTPSLEGTFDFEEPMSVTLTRYGQNFQWTISANQDIPRTFTVMGQVGSSEIDVVNKRAVAYVSSSVSLEDVTVTSLKLGPEGITTYSMDISSLKNFTSVVNLDVSAFGRTETWRLFVEKTTQTVKFEYVEGWTRVAWLSASGIAGKDNGFRYRKAGDGEWIEADKSKMDTDGGLFSICLKGLEPLTEYECKAYCDSDETEVLSFTTEAEIQIPNGGFENVSHVAGQSYYKFYDPSCSDPDSRYMWWGSGNGEGSEGVNGSASMGMVITVPDFEDHMEGNVSVCCKSGSILGMLAAGNIFSGSFAGLVGTSGGIVNFGRPWTTRPVAISFWVKYSTGLVNIVKDSPAGVTVTAGKDYDKAQITVALGTWPYKSYGGTPDSPVRVNTTDKSTFVNYHTDANTVANAELVLEGDASNSHAQWQHVTLELNYHDLRTAPTHIIISCAASIYGDYFTGCDKSSLWLDGFELLYE